jgi:hypothetical protein
MVVKRSVELSPESVARADRQRLAVEEEARAMADVEREAIAVRKNMERLRALREEGSRGSENATGHPATPKKKRKERLAE